ncbi:RRP12-like protein isoform X1 [Salvia hispanica]|uniref:RRP12-like protein isoform X1 n=1 Tax=Salvia hispanica TaxID=49212 RepID=UPI0020095C31|nr:RRP12-like protein isoform X1 [Salvia hispanica]
MEDDAALEAPQSFVAEADICQQLLTRYARSSAAQHRHLCATAAATRSIIQSASMPLTPISYFAAAITSLSNYENLDADALGAVTSFISIVLPLVGKGEIKPEKAHEAVEVLVTLVEESGGKLGTSGLRAVVKCVGVLVAEFCNLKEWGSVGLGFEWLLRFSIDKRPKVRKSAQDCLLKVFKLLEHSSISKKASKSIYSLLKRHMPSAAETSNSKIVDGNRHELISRSEHQEVLHLLNIMKHVIPDLSPKVREKVLSILLKIPSSQSMVAARHVFDVMAAIFETSETKVIISNAEDIFRLLTSYIALGEKNPAESVLFAANLAKTVLGRLHNGDTDQWESVFPMLIEALAGLLSSPRDNVALQASLIVRELMDQHIDGKRLLTMENKEKGDDTTHSAEFKSVQAGCTKFYNLLCSSSPILNKHLLSVVSSLFLKLGKMSDIYMRPILLKLADLMNTTSVSTSEVKHLEDCIGSAVVAMGPEILLSLIPISLNTKDFSCSNIWLIPILKKNIVGSSLQFFIEHIIPLAESFEKGSNKVKNLVIGQDLQAYAHGCWGLLPVFCHWPIDTYQSFPSLSELLIPFLKKDSFMIENIAVSLQELVNENRRVLASDNVGPAQLTDVHNSGSVNAAIDYEIRHVYSKKMASKNIKALSLGAKELLLPLVDVLFECTPETREHLQGAISCLVSICDPSVTKDIFIASLKKLKLLDDAGEHGKLEIIADVTSKEKESAGTDVDRCLILDLASCIVEGCDTDLVNILFSLIKHYLQASDVVSPMEAYQTLSKILEKHSSFCSTEFDVVMDLLAGMKPSENIELVKSRFACLQTLLIHALSKNPDEENTKAFLILNEIILMLKDSREEGRKAAYDALHGLSSKLRSSTDSSSKELYHKLITMIAGYLSGSSPHIKSGVVSALSVLVYSDPDICVTMPDIFPSVMELLHSKAIEVIKAVLGFVKVLVSSLTPNDLHHSLSEIMDGILRWSSVSRYHFKEKIIVILEILMRKCGCANVKALAPEKYKDFVQGVVENRHGKNRPEPSDKSLKGQEKRKRDESAISSKEEGYTGRPWKKRDNQKNNGNSSQSTGHSDRTNFRKGESNRPQDGGAKRFTGKPSGGEKKQKGRSAFKSNERNLHAAASRNPKHTKSARKN